MTDELDRLKERAEGMGYGFVKREDVLNPVLPEGMDYLIVLWGLGDGTAKIIFNKRCLSTAHTLLAALDKDAPVVWPEEEDGMKWLNCDKDIAPAPDGKEWVLVLRDKVVK